MKDYVGVWRKIVFHSNTRYYFLYVDVVFILAVHITDVQCQTWWCDSTNNWIIKMRSTRYETIQCKFITEVLYFYFYFFNEKNIIHNVAFLFFHQKKSIKINLSVKTCKILSFLSSYLWKILKKIKMLHYAQGKSKKKKKM
jgi:hypothetical protein